MIKQKVIVAILLNLSTLEEEYLGNITVLYFYNKPHPLCVNVLTCTGHSA